MVPEVLKQACSGGVSTILLLHTDGSLIASAGDPAHAKLVSAIVTNIWCSYDKVSCSLTLIASMRSRRFPFLHRGITSGREGCGARRADQLRAGSLR